ncbi:hypothetical protein GUITHDRAFT_135875 [Guillardia theta CCMP2712]|uniref:Tyrosine-protein kinase ephrin type A/B receptor-like domain-containing protein n=1 Tax=Guillardia theta (strain CCMP2712) TaxID=905079 RepID=L1JN54_GUITC|nr:hypothetical protein GUITHDRAFT_135875 [Guillardia theta CCMP2712]EKX49709.1 hypothetical protein GUITHDRAFT_135875 [Guillardia theta CCMP2712]|eukprot:XP_005836689.1 hypothetical protein GUITHDRAFT_135875 [Guillardia theta CCMP2712]
MRAPLPLTLVLLLGCSQEVACSPIIPFDSEMKCMPGYEPCVGFQDSWSLLGSINFADTQDERRLVSSASGCAFLSPEDIVFANTGYRNLLHFRFDNRSHVKRWNFTEVIEAGCDISGMERIPQTSSILYTCVDSGQVMKLTFHNDSTLSKEVAASGIEFGPVSQADKTNYPGLLEEDTTIKQCATWSRQMMADVAMWNQEAYVTNRNWNHLLKINLELACRLLPNSTAPSPSPASIHCPPYLDALSTATTDGCCCSDCFNISCCRWGVNKRSSDFNHPRGISISHAQELAVLSSDPFFEILVMPLSSASSSASSVLSGLGDVVAIRHASGRDGLFSLTSSSQLLYIPRRGGSLHPQAKSVFHIQTSNARALCLSEDGEKVGVIGNDQCNLLTGCKSCHTCEAGSYANSSQQKCISCPSGKFSELAGQTACSQCPAGTYSQGKASAIEGANSATLCLDCMAGYFASSEGQTSCEPCAVNTYSNGTGFELCFNCSLGLFANSTGSTTCSE